MYKLVGKNKLLLMLVKNYCGQNKCSTVKLTRHMWPSKDILKYGHIRQVVAKDRFD